MTGPSARVRDEDCPVGEVPPTLPDRVRGVPVRFVDAELRVGPRLTVAAVERLCEAAGIALQPWQRDYMEREINASRQVGGARCPA